MILKIKEDSVRINQLSRDLEKRFGGDYSVNTSGKGRVCLAKSKIIGAVVTLKKNKIYVMGTFPTLWVMVIYSISVRLLLGLPWIIYYMFFRKKMQVCGMEVGAYIRETYANKIVA